MHPPERTLDENSKCCSAAREMTVRDLLIRRIGAAQTMANELKDLMDNLPASYLNSGAYRVSALGMQLPA